MNIADVRTAELDFQIRDNWKLTAENEYLKDRNSKLCELVRDMWVADYAGHFSTLPEHQEHKAAVWQRMCELGIEVE